MTPLQAEQAPLNSGLDPTTMDSANGFSRVDGRSQPASSARGAIALLLALAALCLAIICAIALAAPAAARTLELNADWHFHRGDQPGAEQPGFDDHDWRTVAVPHDWSIEDLPGQSHPFDRHSDRDAGRESQPQLRRR